MLFKKIPTRTQCFLVNPLQVAFLTLLRFRFRIEVQDKFTDEYEFKSEALSCFNEVACLSLYLNFIITSIPLNE